MGSEFLDWYLRLWSVGRGDDEATIAGVERGLRIQLPSLLRSAYLHTSLRDSRMLQLVALDELEVEERVLVFAREQQAGWSWGIPLDRLSNPDPALVANPNGSWEDDHCTLEQFLRFFALTNRPYEAPCVAQADYDEDRLEGAWQQHRVEWRSMQHTLWTNGEAVLEQSSGDLGARDHEALRRAAASLNVDPEELDDARPTGEY